jgi:hypothetical protein
MPLNKGIRNRVATTVIPAKAGIQFVPNLLDPGFRRGDDHACGVTE